MDVIQAEIATLVLETTRTGGMMIVAPLPWRRAPVKVRAALALVLAVVAHGGYRPRPADLDTLVEVGLAVPSELLIGASIGLVVRFSFAVAEIAGETISPLFGLGTSAVFDPGTNASTTPLTKILSLLAGMLAVSAGVHRSVIAALLQGYRVLPPGHVADTNLALPMLIDLSLTAIRVGVQVALPVLGMLLLTQVALAFISRAAPTMQIFSIGFAVSTMVGGLSLLVAMPDMGRMMLRDLLQVGGRIDALFYILTR